MNSARPRPLLSPSLERWLEPPRAALLLGAAVLVCFGVLFWTPQLYDDASFLSLNPLVRGPWPGFGAFLATSFAGEGEYGPLTPLLHWLLFRAGGGIVLLRASSLALHLVNALLFLRVARRLLGGRAWPFLAALLFALYPAHVEVLAFSSFKKHLGVAFFALILLDAESDPGASLRRRRLTAWGALAGALLFKESGLLLAPLAAASERLLPRRKRDSALHAGLWLIAGAYLILRALGLPRRLAGIPEPNAVCHVLTALKIGWWYLGQLALPTSLCLEHSFAPVRSAWSLESAALAAATGAAGFGVLRLARRDRVAGFALFWCGLFLLPFLNLIPYLNLSLVANRYLYLSSAGFLLALARLASAARARARLGLAAAAGALAVFYASRDVVHGAMFSNPLTLWVATSRCAPGNPRPHAALASVLLGMRRYAEVEAEAAQAIALEPQFPLPYQSFAAACAETGKLEQALGLARERVALDPDPAGLQVLGTLLMRAGRLEEACPMLEGALARDPEGWDIALSLGECELKAGRLARARERLSAAAKAPQLRSRALWLLGDVELRQGRPEASLSLRELSVELNPLDRDHLRALAGAYARAAGTREVWRLYARSLGAVDAAAVWTVGDSRRQLQELRAELVRDRDGILSRPARSRRG